MTRRLGIAGLIVLMIAVGIWAVLPKRGETPAAAAKALGQPQKRVQILQKSSAATDRNVVTSSALWQRPSSRVAAQNVMRVRFSLLRLFGADEQTIDRLTRGNMAAAVQELKQRAQRGDAAAANVLGYMVRRTCPTAIVNGAGSASQEQQFVDLQALPAADAEWLRAAITEKNVQEQPLVTVCRQSMDKSEIAGWVAKAADQGNGVSLYLLSTSPGSQSMAYRQQKLEEAADAGYPEAEAFLAQSEMYDQTMGLKPDNAKHLLEEAAKSLPYAESILATCEFNGCPGIDVDIESAVAHAREAAQRGDFQAMTEIGPKAQASQIEPDEVQAWSLVAAVLAQQGCSTNSLSVQNMTAWTRAFSSKAISTAAHDLAEHYWQDYSTQMMSGSGCTS